MLVKKFAADTLARKDAQVKSAGIASAIGQIVLALAFLQLSPNTPLLFGIKIAIVVLNLVRLSWCTPTSNHRYSVAGLEIDRYSIVVVSTAVLWMFFELDLLALHDLDNQQTVFVLLTIIGLGAAGSTGLALRPRTYATFVIATNIIPAVDILLGWHRLEQWTAVPYCLLVYALFLLRQSREHRVLLQDLIQAEVRSNLERDQFDTILNACPDVILCVDRNLKCVAANHPTYETFGLRQGNVMDRPLRSTGLPVPMIECIEAFKESGLTQASSDITMSGWAGLRRYRVFKSKLDHPFIHSIFIYRDVEDERLAVAALLDQQAIVQNSSKLVALGTMAGGIAHEINNPLAIISGRVQAMRDQFAAGTGDPAKFAAGFDTVVRTVERIAKIIRGLLQISRDGTNDPLEVKAVADVVSDFLPLVEKFMAKGQITIDATEIEPGLLISCRSVEISQVLLNLVSNAADEVVKTAGPRWINISARTFDQWIVISVTDSGPGVPPELRDKIMQPFFTTKDVGKGTGIGLSISRGIAESHGGRLELDGTSARTRFNVYLPRPTSAARAV